MTAVKTIPANLGDVIGHASDLLGLDIGDLSNVESATKAQDIGIDTFGAMIERFDGQAGAFSYLLFVLMYFPCVATIGVIVREAGKAWAAFVALWTTGIAYSSATLFYQIARFNQHPVTSAEWVIGILVLALVSFMMLRSWAERGNAHRHVLVEKAA